MSLSDDLNEWEWDAESFSPLILSLRGWSDGVIDKDNRPKFDLSKTSQYVEAMREGQRRTNNALTELVDNMALNAARYGSSAMIVGEDGVKQVSIDDIYKDQDDKEKLDD